MSSSKRSVDPKKAAARRVVTGVKRVTVQSVPAGTVVLGAAVLNKLIKNPAACEQFAFLRNPPQHTYKSCCGRTVTGLDYEELKRRVLDLDTDRANALKSLIPAAQLKVVARSGGKIKSKTL